MGALYLASKLEECPTRMRDLINVYDLLTQRTQHMLDTQSTKQLNPEFTYAPMSYFGNTFLPICMMSWLVILTLSQINMFSSLSVVMLSFPHVLSCRVVFALSSRCYSICTPRLPIYQTVSALNTIACIHT